MRTFQVEYMSRPDECEHIVQFDNNLRDAHAFAKKMSDEHDGTSCLVALDDNKDEPGRWVSGHVEYSFGSVGEREGIFRNIVLPGER